MKKYIITNCPTRFEPSHKPKIRYNSKLICCDNLEYCKDVNDCLPKRIVAECQEAMRVYDQTEYFEDDCDKFMGESFMAERILDMFNIKEIK